MAERPLQAFSPSALERIAQVIGGRYTGTEMTAFFRKAGYPDIQHDGSTKWKFAYQALEHVQGLRNGPYNVAKIIQLLCDPQEFFGDGDAHQSMITTLNEVVAFYGLAIDGGSGRLLWSPDVKASLRSATSEETSLFDAREFHAQVRLHGRQLFIERRWFHAVFECCKAFDKCVREKAEIDKHGAELMGAAWSLKGTLKLNTQQSETERNEQEGLMHICMGLMRAVRNPESHEPELDWPLSRQDALDVLSMLSFLFRQLDRTAYFAVG